MSPGEEDDGWESPDWLLMVGVMILAVFLVYIFFYFSYRHERFAQQKQSERRSDSPKHSPTEEEQMERGLPVKVRNVPCCVFETVQYLYVNQERLSTHTCLLLLLSHRNGKASTRKNRIQSRHGSKLSIRQNQCIPQLPTRRKTLLPRYRANQLRLLPNRLGLLPLAVQVRTVRERVWSNCLQNHDVFCVPNATKRGRMLSTRTTTQSVTMSFINFV